LKKLIYDMLTCVYVKEGLVKILVQILVNVDPDINSRLQFLAEVVSEVHEPMTDVSVEGSAEEMRKKQLLVRKECYAFIIVKKITVVSHEGQMKIYQPNSIVLQ